MKITKIEYDKNCTSIVKRHTFANSPIIRSVDVVEQVGEVVFSYVLLVLNGLLELVVVVLRLVVVELVVPAVAVGVVLMTVVGPRGRESGGCTPSQ